MSWTGMIVGAGLGYAASFAVWRFRIEGLSTPLVALPPRDRSREGTLPAFLGPPSCKEGFLPVSAGVFGGGACLTPAEADAYHHDLAEAKRKELVGRVSFAALGAGFGLLLTR